MILNDQITMKVLLPMAAIVDSKIVANPVIYFPNELLDLEHVGVAAKTVILKVEKFSNWMSNGAHLCIRIRCLCVKHKYVYRSE